ncbi:hypothetical protein Sjap_012644 [Stephania japonica]|uniref:Clustered mitochondria protein homolog n=1 Tax=Stephania japonica TaxID=461633 RepID=A0AAP0IWA5_9MAGN
MAGKSSRARSRRAPQSSSEAAAAAGAKADESLKAEGNGAAVVAAEERSGDTAPEANGAKQAEGDVHLYPVSVRAQNGEKLELQLNPGDSVMDLRQFLLDAPETCYITCYDLILHTKDGSVSRLEDYNEISEVADITSGGCSLEMAPALYDDRSIRAHVHRARELLSLSSLPGSLSTSLALQHETSRNNSTEAAKADTSDVDCLGFMENVTASLSNLTTSPAKYIKCVESIAFSSFNPPPSYRRLLGDLIYIDLTTLEGHKFCVTGTTKYFYVNSSTGNTLDPRQSKSAFESTTIIGLLQKISPKFKKAFREILEQKASAHPFENVQSLMTPNSWLGAYPLPDHKRDASRAEDALTLSYGSELIGMQRDWNEELQCCREFPHTTHQESILRDRALYKVTSDFVNAAISGAIGVISRCIPPINPADPECFHMYVHNNIFFSFAVDGDLGQLPRNHASNLEVKDGSSLNELSERASSNSFHETGSDSNVEKFGSSNSDEVHSVGDAIPEVPADLQLTDSEQATYASANNDLKGTKAYQEADVPGLYNLAMAIIDYRGHRVVAQSIIPGILQGDKSDSLLYGSVDNGKKICWNEVFHSKVLEAAKRLHLKEHAVIDGSGNVVKLAAPVECKGIVGSDDRHYLLDLMRVTPRDANYTGPGSRFFVLRPELITAFFMAEAADRCKDTADRCKDTAKHGAEISYSSSDVKDDQVLSPSEDSVHSDSRVKSTNGEVDAKVAHDCDSVSAENGEVVKETFLNPNVFTEFKLSGSEEERATDEESVRKVSLYLKEVVLPKFVKDLCTLEVSPMDGHTLTEALHAHGINVRYIGKVADMTRHLPHIWDLCVIEMIVRSAKHVVKEILRESLDHDLAPAISHFFNCFFGDVKALGMKGTTRTQRKDLAGILPSSKSSMGHVRGKIGTSEKKSPSSYMNINSFGLWSDIYEFARFKYQFELPEDSQLRVRKVPAIRNLCQKVGITIVARKYDLDAEAPFQTSDILNLQPVVKHSVPVSLEAKDLVETGKARLAEGMLSEAYSLFSEAFSILQQVTGPMHREVANCCRYLAMVLYHAGDLAGALLQQHKELIINERCVGLDHPDTAHSYGNMALFYHGLNQTELALRHMSRTLLLLGLSCGPDHPEVALTYINVAMMYQDIGKMDVALRYLQEALKKNERLLGEEHIQTAVCYHALAIAFNCMGAFKLSLQHETKTYDILVKQLGEEDQRTRDSQNWIKTFKMRDLQVNAQKQKGQAANATSTQKAIDILKAHPNLMQAFQAVAAGGAGNSGASINKSLGSAMMGEPLPRGRGVDERAARAVAEARKKAAARGLLVRPHGVPVQALPPFTQLLNIINSGMSQEAQNNIQSEEPKNEANGHAGKEKGDGKENGSAASAKEDQTPVGLGAGLATLDTKKPKMKAKAA